MVSLAVTLVLCLLYSSTSSAMIFLPSLSVAGFQKSTSVLAPPPAAAWAGAGVAVGAAVGWVGAAAVGAGAWVGAAALVGAAGAAVGEAGGDDAQAASAAPALPTTSRRRNVRRLGPRGDVGCMVSLLCLPTLDVPCVGRAAH